MFGTLADFDALVDERVCPGADPYGPGLLEQDGQRDRLLGCADEPGSHDRGDGLEVDRGCFERSDVLGPRPERDHGAIRTTAQERAAAETAV